MTYPSRRTGSRLDEPASSSSIGKIDAMYSCPCCGYRTLPEQGDYDLCPVCWWEDDGVEPWEYSGPNAQTLVEAQQEYLAERRPYRRRPGRVRAPKKKEARDPDWQPIELTNDLLERAEQARRENERFWEEEQRRTAQEIANNPEGPFKEYNAAVASLQAQATHLSHQELKAQLTQASSSHGMRWSKGDLELMSRLMSDQHYYRDHPVHMVCWMIRYSRPGTYKRSWEEVRTGTIHFAG